LVSEESVNRKITDKTKNYYFLQLRFEFLSYSSGAAELMILHHRGACRSRARIFKRLWSPDVDSKE
jgi:hypothetical protein